MGNNYIIHLQTGNRIITEEEAIANAEEQKAKGIKPHYVLFDGDKKEKLSNPGWLIWSTWKMVQALWFLAMTESLFYLLAGSLI